MVSCGLMRRDAEGVISACPEPTASLIREQWDEAGRTCRSAELLEMVRRCVPGQYPAALVPSAGELEPALFEPFTAEQPDFAGPGGPWHPDVLPQFVRVVSGQVVSYFSESSYWPALLTGVGGLLDGVPAGGRGLHGLQPCLRAETVTGRLRRMAFTQAHIDLVAAAPGTGLCLDAVAAMHRLVCRMTGIPASSVRVRVGDSRAWTGLLGPHAQPLAIRDLRQDFLDPAAARVALQQADPGLLASQVRPELERAGLSGIPQGVVEAIEYRVRSGRYEPGYAESSAAGPVRDLVRACEHAGLAALTDARSARIGYSGLTWQLDCAGPGGWTEVAGGGDYTHAAALLYWLRTGSTAPPRLCVAGSAVGIERALALAV